MMMCFAPGEGAAGSSELQRRTHLDLPAVQLGIKRVHALCHLDLAHNLKGVERAQLQPACYGTVGWLGQARRGP